MNCIICKSDKTEILDTHDSSISSDLQMISERICTEICHSCGHVFNSDGSRNKTQNFYQNSYNLLDFSFVAETTVYDKNKQSSLSDWRLEQLVIFSKKKNHGKILDIGCGKGNFLYKFHNQNPGWKLYGIESSKSLLSLAKKNIPEAVLIPSLYSKDQFNEKFDIIVALTVLEHLEDPIQFLQILYDDLSDDGIVCFDIPNFKSNPSDLFVYDHLSHFTKETLTNVLLITGFKVVKIIEDINKIPLLVICSKTTQKSLLNHYSMMNKLVSKHIEFNTEQFRIFEQVSKNYDDIGIIGNGISLWAGIQNKKLLKSKIRCIYDENDSIINSSISNIPINDLKKLNNTETPLILCLSPCYIENILKKSLNIQNVFFPFDYDYYKQFFT